MNQRTLLRIFCQDAELRMLTVHQYAELRMLTMHQYAELRMLTMHQYAELRMLTMHQYRSTVCGCNSFPYDQNIISNISDFFLYTCGLGRYVLFD
jgi:hypothetical protein